MAAKIGELETQPPTCRSFAFFCPGCKTYHSFITGPTKPTWTWNGSFESPTFVPSLLYPKSTPRCHLNLTDGVIQYHEDCGHELAGKQVPCPDWDD